jgi:rod shape-determining protein MreC
MPGLSFANSQTQQRRPGRWWIPVVLIILSVALITLSVRFDNGGPFAVARDAVQSVTKPVQVACSGLSTPFKSLQNVGTSDEVAQLEQENEQLQTLVAELEEYRQQDQRLTSLIKLSDTYGLEYTSAEVVGTTSGWNRTATINKGSADGIQVGMGVMSSCGLYGQVESVTENQSVVRLVNDANSSVSAMVQSSRARGILTGSYDGTLTLSYVSVEKKVGEGDIVISSGQ